MSYSRVVSKQKFERGGSLVRRSLKLLSAFQLHMISPPVFFGHGRRLMALLTFMAVAGGGTAITRAQDVRTGTQGVASQEGTINFADLARETSGGFAGGDLSETGSEAEVIPASAGPNQSPAPSASFLALLDDGTAFVPDTQGAVGPNHLMVTLTSEIRIQNRSGTPISTVSLDSFWASFGNPIVFDPRILYDPFAQRWIFVAVANPALTNPGLLIAVSQTSDPTGNWNRYFIDTDTANPIYPEAPNVGFNRDWIAVQANMFRSDNFNFHSSDIFVFPKANLYAGGAGNHTRFSNNDIGGSVNAQVPAVTFDNTLSTLYLVANWNSNFEGFGYLRIFTISGPVNAPVFNVGSFVGTFQPSEPWDDFAPGNANFAPQLGTTNKIHQGDARLQNVVYRNGTLWTAHTIFRPATAPTRSAVQWWEVTPGGATIQQGLIEDPGSQVFYSFPSIGVNSRNDVVVGYSRFSASQYPSANYAFRVDADVFSSLRGEQVLKAGEAPYFAPDLGRNRWGEWSATVVDPVNDIDLWTIQEYAATPSSGIDRWGTWWGRISPPADLVVTKADSPDPVVAGAELTYTLTVTNANFGKAVSGVRLVDTLPAGSIFVSASASHGTCNHLNGVVTCNIGELPELTRAIASIVIRPTQSGQITNVVTALGNSPELNPADNTAVALTTVNPASDLAVFKSDSPDPVNVNSALTYSITVTNLGPSAAAGVTLTDTLPSNVTFVSATPSQGICSRSGNVVTCSLGSMGNQAAVAVTIIVTPMAGGVSITNRAAVAASTPDANTANNAATAVTRVNAMPTVSSISNRSIDEDTSTGAIQFTVGDLETPAASLNIALASSNPSLVPNANLVLGGSGANRTISATPLLNQAGATTITITVTDADGATAVTQFVLTVNPINDPPTISNIIDQTIDEDTVLGPIDFQVNDIETPAANLIVSASSSNPTLVPNGNISLGGSGVTRTITVTPATNQFGTATITVTVNDGVTAQNDTFVLTVNPVNDPPSISAIANRASNEDTPTGAISFTISDPETAAGSLMLQGVSSNPTLVPEANIIFGGSGTSRTVNVTPALNQFGSATITIRVRDGTGGTNSTSFQLSINPVNDPPTLNAINDIAIDEDAGQQTGNLQGISSGASNEADTLSVTATSNNPGLIPNPSVNYTSPQSDASLTFAPVANVSGSAVITVTVNDNRPTNNLFSRTFTVTVNPINDPPTISSIPNQTIDEDTTTGPLPFAIGDIETPAANLIVSATSSNPDLLPNSNIVLGGTGASRTITLTPAANQFGAATITVTVSDGSSSTNATFDLTVTPINDPPVISAILDHTTSEDTPVTVSISVSDRETAPASLTLMVNSSNLALVPAANISVDGTGTNRTVTITPLQDQFGSTTIAISVRDIEGLTNTAVFMLTVNPVNDPPGLSAIADVAIDEDSGPTVVALAGIHSGAVNENRVIAVTATSGNPSIIPHPQVSYATPNADGTLIFTPAPDANGTVTITVTVNDNGASNNITMRSFRVTVREINDPPTISAVSPQNVDEDTPTLPIPFLIGDAETPATDLMVSAHSSNEELVLDSDIIFGGSGSNRTVIVRPLTNQFGSATITLFVTDGSNAMASTSFELTVNPVDDAPSISSIPNRTIDKDTSTGAIPFSVNDPETIPANLTLSAASSNPMLVPVSSIVFGGSGVNRTVTVTPVADRVGVAIITITVSDGAKTNSTSFTLTVRRLNTPPTISAIPDHTIDEDTRSAAIPFVIGDADTPAANLIVTASSSNPSLLPLTGIVLGGAGSNRTVTLTPAANQFGTANVSIRVVDDESASVTNTFVLTVRAVPDAPSVSAIADHAIEENTVSNPIPFTVSDPETPAADLTVAATSSNLGLVPVANITFSGSGANRTLTIRPQTNGVGFATITITVTDSDGLSGMASFMFTVVPVNDAPSISAIPNQTIDEDTVSPAISFSIGDVDSPIESLMLSVHSSNPILIPAGNITLEGNGTNWSVRLTPAANRSGTTDVTITVSDGLADASATFTVTVRDVNDPPSIAAVGNQSTAEDAPLSIPLAVADRDSDLNALVVTATSSNTELVPNTSLVFGGTAANRTLTITPQTNQFGTTTITVTVFDGVSASQTSFTLSVNSVNDSPTLETIADRSVNEDAGSQTVTLTGITSGAANESQVLAITALSSDPSVVPNPAVNYNSPNSAGTLMFTPVANASGSAVITVRVNDGGATNNIFERTFVVTVGAVNDPPTISDISNQATTEDRPLVVPFLVSDPDTPLFRLTITATSSNPALVPNANILPDGSGPNRSVMIVPAADAFGSTTITLTVSDGTSSASDTFVLTVSSVNDAPTLDPLPDLGFSVSPGFVTVDLTGIGSGAGNENQALSVTAVSDDTSVVPTPTVTYSGGNSGNIRFRPQNNRTGSANVTVTVNDGQATFSQSFLISIKPNNNSFPTISDIVNRAIAEDSNTGAISFTVGDSQTPAGSLVVTAKSSNPSLVPNSNIVLGGTGANRTITVIPLPNQTGSTLISLRVDDGNLGIATDTFVLTVNPVNDQPVISNIGNQTVFEDTATAVIGFTVGDVETPAANLTLSASSSNPTLVPVANVLLGGSGTNRALMVVPATNQNGTAIINLTVNDGTGGTASTGFMVTVTGVNDAPTISAIANVIINEDSSTAPIAFTVGDVDSSLSGLSVSGSSSNPALIPNSNIVLAGTGANRTVTVTPAANAFGSAIITIAVTDGGGGIGSTNFLLTVNPLNDPPTLAPISNITATGGEQTVSLTGISSGAPNENQVLAISAISSNPNAIPHPFVSYLSPNSAGSLTIDPRANAQGPVTITVTVNDGQAANNLVSRTFSVTLPNRPSISDIPDQMMDEDTSSAPVLFAIGDATTPANNLQLGVISSNPTLIPKANIVVAGSGANRSLTLMPLPNRFGTASITLVVTNASGNTASDSFEVTVNSVNDVPTLDPIADRSVDPAAGTQTVPLSGIGSGAFNENQILMVSATSSDPSLLPHPGVSYSALAGTGTLSLTPVANASGLVTVTVTVRDSGGMDHGGQDTVTRSFTVMLTGSGAAILRINRMGNNLMVSWPTNLAEFRLQSSSGIKGAPWTTVNAAPELMGDRFVVILSPNGREQFFRLASGGVELPRLMIALAGSQVVISWPAAFAEGYSLQSNPDLRNKNDWTLVPEVPVLAGGFYYVTNAMSGTQRYYRLAKVEAASEARLTIRKSDNSIIVAWPIAATDFVLESRTGWSTPASWAPVAIEPVQVGGENRVTIIEPSGEEFFRLRQE